MSKELLKHAVNRMTDEQAQQVLNAANIQFQVKGKWMAPQEGQFFDANAKLEESKDLKGPEKRGTVTGTPVRFGAGDVTAVRVGEDVQKEGTTSLSPDAPVDVRPKKVIPENAQVTEQLHNPESRTETVVTKQTAKGTEGKTVESSGTTVPNAAGRL